MRRFDIALYLEAIERFKITETAMVPAMIAAVLKSPQATPETLGSLCYVWSAGSPLRQAIQRDFRALLAPEAKISQVWGLTEAGWISTLFWPEGDEPGSVGRVLPGVSIRYESCIMTLHRLLISAHSPSD